MPIRDVEDAVEVRDRVKTIFDAPGDGRAAAVRALFVEELDFEAARGEVGLDGAPKGARLPPSVERVAHLDGVHVVYLPLETPRVRKADMAEAAKAIWDQLDGDLLLVVSNHPCTQLQLVYPNFEGARPVLRRMVVERDLPQRTAIQQVAQIYRKAGDPRSIRTALADAFSVERVTTEFFREYKRVFEEANKQVAGLGDDTKTFVQTLFNRLMFIYFLSRKGWLTFNGDKDYLNALWRDCRSVGGEHKNFYIDRLRLVFFEGLNNPRSQDTTAKSAAPRLIGSVPFLNGGLFEKTELDHQVELSSSETVTVVPDEAIEPILIDLFDHFNFTVMESTPFDVEVAVDPEMLGKVFEELVTGRHDSGAYYTPRPVVSFMCREALKGYLEGRDTGVAPEAIAAFVDGRETSGISSVASARKVAEALDEVTVVDPACGSGAYLLGMMQELVELQTALFNVGVDEKGIYDLKLHIIQRNLYGVDIDDFAVNIAMLRLWLSLAIEYEGEKPEPLPNLDFKVLCGDSLLGPDPSAGVEVQGALGYDADRVRALGELKAAYMRASEGEEKKSLRQDVLEAKAEIGEAFGAAGIQEDAVDWRVEFAEVFAQRRGFDIAIANPPYVESRSSSISEVAKDAYGRRFFQDWGVALPKGSDVFIYFFARAGQLLSPSGKAAFITQNGWLSSNYGKAFQEFTVGRMGFTRIVDTIARFFAQAQGPNINAVISFFDRGASNDIEFQMVDGNLSLQSSRRIPTHHGLKWGNLFAMPEWFRVILEEFATAENREGKPTIEFGQGINVPKGQLSRSVGGVGIVVETPNFGCYDPDAYLPIGTISEARLRRPPALMMPRGVGRYYCSLNGCETFTYSGVELYLPKEVWESDLHYCLWLYLNSSFAWLFREITGRSNLGGGMLKAEATDMKGLPVYLDFDFGDEAREMFARVSNIQPLAVEAELRTPHHRRIDEVVGKFLGISHRMDDIRTLLVDKVSFRGSRARGKRLEA